MEKYEKAAERLAADLSTELRKANVLGLGSGSTVSSILKKADIPKGKLAVPTSIQIKLVADTLGFVATSLNSEVELTIDGADQVDRRLNMIKGGGGALLKEKILTSFSKRLYIVVTDKKLSERLCEGNVPIPIEVSPFGLYLVQEKVLEMGGKPQLRKNEKGYPSFTENGNVIIDAFFEPLEEPRELETKIKSTVGVIEVGIFTRKPDLVFVLKENGSYETLK
jgi:ribose 5-phosphate isomerase A